MANHLANEDITPQICIPEAINEDGVTFYVVSVTVGEFQWTSRRRYRDFYELHESLIVCGVDKDSLPPKKLLGTKDPTFILKRRRNLESYLQSVFKFLERSMPQTLLEFLEFTNYDCNYVLQELSGQHGAFDVVVDPDHDTDDDKEDEESPQEKWTPLELHAISERLKTPRPAIDVSANRKYDFANLADYCCRLKRLTITGTDDPLGTSNIIVNRLRFDLSAFKSLTKLVLTDCRLTSVDSFGFLRQTLSYLQATRCEIGSIAEILHCSFTCSTHQTWDKLTCLDLRFNVIQDIDDSLSSASNLSTLLLSGNRINEIRNLTHTPLLNILDLSSNSIRNTDDLHVKLGQVTRVNLSSNKITNLSGFSKLYSLSYLNVSGNRIRDLESVFPVSSLPCLETLNLQGNKVTSVVDYRLKVFESFGKRCSEIILDNEAASQSEVDRVSVLMALRVAREGKSPTSLFGNLPRRA